MTKRAQLLPAITELRAQGLTWKQIAERLNVTWTFAADVFNDPDGSKRRERQKRYEGVCVDCGGPTSGSGGFGNAPSRCLRCSRGDFGERPSQPSVRRSLPVRLGDISIDARLAAAWEANRVEQGETERQEILFAALSPSEQVYWLAESARPLLERVAA